MANDTMEAVGGESVVRLSEKAVAEARRVLAEDKRPGIGLRLGVKGGGCSGLSYVIDFGTERENDIKDPKYGFPIFIDPKSSLYLKDTVLDFQGGFMGRGFKFENPNATNTCGCGESFSV